MVRKILADSKTQTRRILKRQPLKFLEYDYSDGFKRPVFEYPDGKEMLPKSPYGWPGDLLWVRENWIWEGVTSYDDLLPVGEYIYAADVNHPEDYKWRPSIHMPKRGARIWLMITDVDVQRLQNISEKEAVEEGAELHTIRGIVTDKSYTSYLNGFMRLWCDIHGVESWNENPWVWKITFNVISTSGREKAYQKINEKVLLL